MFHFTCKQTTLLSSPYVASVGDENNSNCYSKVLPLVVKCLTIFLPHGYHNTKYYHKMVFLGKLGSPKRKLLCAVELLI